MPQTEFAGDITYDWEMWIGRTAIVEDAPVITWTQIFGFTSLPFPDKTPEDVDVTHLQSPGFSRESTPGMAASLIYSQEKQLWPGNAGDTLLNTLHDLAELGTKEDVLVEFNVDPSGAGLRRTYRGQVRSYNPTGEVGGVAMAALSIAIFERQASNARVISGS